MNKPRHSIIIPHRNRIDHLTLCVQSLLGAARETDRDDFEILVVDNGSKILPAVHPKVRVIRNRQTMPIFNKCVLLNEGIECAAGDLLTFLDADAIVGPSFLATADTLRNHREITRLCYRVRYLPESFGQPASYRYDATLPQDHRQAFESDEKYPIGFEGRGRPEWNRNFGEPLFGNSQWSIRRETLGDLRFNEDFVGAGYEDLWMIRAVWHRCGESYRGHLVTDLREAMFHVQHPRENPTWRTSAIVAANQARYFRDSKYFESGKRNDQGNPKS